MTGVEYTRTMTEHHTMDTMEQEDEPLLLEQDYTHHIKPNTNRLTDYWTTATSSVKHFFFGSTPSEKDDDSDISLYEDWSTAPTSSSWRPCILRSLYLLLGLPLGLLILLFITYAILFRPPPLHSPLGFPATNSSTARLLTYNIFMRPPGVKNNANDYKDARLDDIINTILPHYDIITFQEAFAFGNHRVDRLIEAAQQRGFGYLMSPRHGPWELAADGGLLLLSRYPILQVDVLEYPRGLHSDWLARKGALHALIGLDHSSLDIYTTHTQASYGKGGTRSQQDIQMRLDQFERLGRFINDTMTTGTIVAMGDFNIDSIDHTMAITDKAINSSRAYTMMMHRLPLIDAVYTAFGYHPITFGDYARDDQGKLVPAETVLTHSQQVLTGQSIDQLLWSPLSPVRLTNVTIEKFLVSDKPYTQLSDHYGISCLVSF
ncbi:Endonuclease/exonuclease/phosphatase [Chlamydoabsidia padenii]|nr:Endonuclease/exonuclease/phosphatase [Chlamydoabsidia padenii]